MILEFTTTADFDFITRFSKELQVPVYNNLLVIPEAVGEGHVRKVVFGSDFRMLIHNYKLKEDFTIRRNPAVGPMDMIAIYFYNNEQPIDLEYNRDRKIKFSRKNESAIQVTSSDLRSSIRFPAHSQTHYIVIGITAGKLASLLNIDGPGNILQTIISGTGSFLYFESLEAEGLHLLQHIVSLNMNEPLSNFYAQVKVQELLYHLFHKLSGREDSLQKTISNADIEKLLLARNMILADLGMPPLLPTLAAAVGMGETKLKLLFKQTFGDTVYNYFQKARMEEAAFLLRQAGYSVSEVGYQLGFSNLSHFSRLFGKHYGITPKKYASAG